MKIAPAPIRRSVVVRAAPARAFDVFVRDFDRWWPRTHTTAAAPLARAVLEAHPGGRWYGLGADGVESEWGEVLAWEPPVRLLLAWRIGAQWTYDPSLLTEVKVTFTDLGDGRTRVDLEHRGLERLGEEGAAAREAIASPQGWGGLLESFRVLAEG